MGVLPLSSLIRYLRYLYPPGIRIAVICDNFSPRLTTATAGRSVHVLAGRVPVRRPGVSRRVHSRYQRKLADTVSGQEVLSHLWAQRFDLDLPFDTPS